MTTRSVRQAFVGAGANLGDRLTNLRSALARLQATPGITHVASSSVYETAPVGVVDQPSFLNLVFGVETVLSPETLLERLLAIERERGRVRTVRWGPRTLDLDLLAFEGEQRDASHLILPHPRMLERRFVAEPLRELLATERFGGSAWDTLREQLDAAHPSGHVERWAEPLA